MTAAQDLGTVVAWGSFGQDEVTRWLPARAEEQGELCHGG